MTIAHLVGQMASRSSVRCDTVGGGRRHMTNQSDRWHEIAERRLAERRVAERVVGTARGERCVASGERRFAERHAANGASRATNGASPSGE
ncbi:MAG: hypothetical protein R3C32_10720 [Chloroflexota bacterium]